MFIKPFKKISKGDTLIAGGKGASLGEMIQNRISVPDGFVLLSNAFERFLEETDLNVEIDTILHIVDHNVIHTVEDASEKIQSLILNSKISEDIAKEIKKEFKKLDSKFVAVRSSATAEDSLSEAWAGQLDSFLNTTEENLLENIRKCWASLFTPRAIFYRFEKKLHKEIISVAVVIQKMVESEMSGIAFSVHPVTEDRNQIIIEAGFGLGEAIVSGSITPDSYVVEKEPRRIFDINVNTQNKKLVRLEGGGNEWVDLSETEGGKQVLTEEQIQELSELILKIENHYSVPQDIEWASQGGKFYVVQSRPITTLGNIKPKKKLFTKEHSREYSLFRLASWYSSMNDGLRKIIGDGVGEACAVYSGGDLVSVYYETEELQRVFQSIAQKCSDKDYLMKQIQNYLSLFEKLKQYYIGQKKINSIEELRKVQELYSLVWAYTAIIFVIPTFSVDEKLKKIAYDARVKTQEYNETPEEIFKEALERFFPKLKGKTRFILPEEVWNNKIESEDFLKQIKQREKGFLYYRDDIYTGGFNQNLEKFGIELVDNISAVSGKIEQKNKDEINGQSAYGGKIRGRVRLISSVKDIEKVNKDSVLVAAMTMPKYLPAMKKASAFITDEGGITCHAAIVSRELKKPCIIGTKIATQVLKDGDLVEVDANKGVVRILEKVKK